MSFRIYAKRTAPNRGRIHRPNQTREPVKKLMHPCGFCFHGGGTLRKATDEEKLKVWTEKKLVIVYVHKELRFCESFHVPKRFERAFDRLERLQERRDKQTFHVRGFIPRQNSQPRKMV